MWLTIVDDGAVDTIFSKLNNGSFGAYDGAGNPGGNAYDWLYRGDGTKKIQMRTQNGAGTATIDYNVADGQWHHLVATYDWANNLVTPYLDGERAGTTSASLSGSKLFYDKGNAPLVIGSSGTGSFQMNGTIDEFRIYRRVLQPEEIREHWNRGKTDAGFVKSNKFRVLNTTLGKMFEINSTATTFFSGAVESVKITSDGNVGIGTTTPDTKLKVSGSVNVTGDIYYDGSLIPYSPLMFGIDTDVGYTRICMYDKQGYWTGYYSDGGIFKSEINAPYCIEKDRINKIRRDCESKHLNFNKIEEKCYNTTTVFIPVEDAPPQPEPIFVE